MQVHRLIHRDGSKNAWSMTKVRAELRPDKQFQRIVNSSPTRLPYAFIYKCVCWWWIFSRVISKYRLRNKSSRDTSYRVSTQVSFRYTKLIIYLYKYKIPTNRIFNYVRKTLLLSSESQKFDLGRRIVDISLLFILLFRISIYRSAWCFSPHTIPIRCV